MESKCPVCDRVIAESLLQRHVNSCLDTLESLPRENTGNDEVVEESVHSLAEVNHDKRKMPSALGLLMNNSKKKKVETKAKLGPSLTKLRIEQKLLQNNLKNRDVITHVPEVLNKNSLPTQVDNAVDISDVDVTTNSAGRSLSVDEVIAVPGKNSEENSPEQPDGPLNRVEKDNHSIVDVSINNVRKDGSSESSKDDVKEKKKSVYLLKAQELNELKRLASIPIAHRMRPKSLEDYYGQDKLLGENGILTNIIQSDNIPSFILWGSPGVGKTTLARIIATSTKHKFIELSGAEANAKKLKETFLVVDNEFALTGRKTILFLDEIHRFNKAVQDLLLPVIERGLVTIIGATTENPSFTLNNALLSRMHTFVMEPLSLESIEKILLKALYQVNKLRINLYHLHYISLKKDALKYICELSQGDSRIALNILESIHAYLSTDKYTFEKEEVEIKIKTLQSPGVINVTEEVLRPLLSTRNFHQMYDRQGENHYDTISAFHKSVRGSNADAAIYYLVKMLSGGEDPLFIARRMVVIASEDIGLRDSSCLPFAIAVKDAIEFVGMPEGEIILAHCAVKLARAPKSTKSYRALRNAQALIQENPDLAKLPIPMHLRNAPTQLMKDLGYGDTYKYNPKFKYGKVAQTYLPPEISDSRFVEETHLGTVEDEAIDRAEYEKFQEADEAYAKFKKFYKKQLREQYFKQVDELEQSKIPGQFSSTYSYDEFLSKEDQPEYFDGQENDHYSDDPDCSNNFEHPYDEFHDPESQPDYYAEDTANGVVVDETEDGYVSLEDTVEDAVEDAVGEDASDATIIDM